MKKLILARDSADSFLENFVPFCHGSHH